MAVTFPVINSHFTLFARRCLRAGFNAATLEFAIEGMYDQMGWGAPIELWQSWGQPDIWRLPHGHISTALTAIMPGLPGRILRWLAPRLEAGRKSNA